MAKYLTNNSGNITEVSTIAVSAGAGDSGKIPGLTAAGVLDATIVNSTVASVGAGSSGKLPALDSSGRLDPTTMPVGVSADTAVITTSEVIPAGSWVNIFSSSGAKVRNADGSNGRGVDGFTLLGAGSGAPCTVFLGPAMNTAVSGKTPGAVQYLSNVTPGASMEIAPTTPGHLVQILGKAISATQVNANIQSAITLA